MNNRTSKISSHPTPGREPGYPGGYQGTCNQDSVTSLR
jgi:hypothetical protein